MATKSVGRTSTSWTATWRSLEAKEASDRSSVLPDVIRVVTLSGGTYIAVPRPVGKRVSRNPPRRYSPRISSDRFVSRKSDRAPVRARGKAFVSI
jgi:hypothetical protein